MSPQDKALDLIKKLLAKANDESCTRDEAAAFAVKAAEIAAKEQLELSDSDWENRKQGRPIGTYHFWPEEHDIKRSKRRVKWQEDLISAICRSQQCRIILMGGNTYDIVGRKGNVEIAVYLCVFLTRFVLDVSEREYCAYFRKCVREGDVSMASGFKASWQTSFVREVQQRILELKRDLELEYKGSTALVRLTDELDDVQDWMDENRSLRSSTALSGNKNFNHQGSTQGREAGSGVDITGSSVGASASNVGHRVN